MFAPQPIQFRYDDAGALGLAAQGAGRAAGWQSQHAMDMQFVNQEANRRQQAWEFAQNNQLEAQKLQTAYALRGSTGMSGLAGQQYSPITQAITNAKTSVVHQLDPDVHPDEQAVIKAMMADPTTRISDIGDRVQKANADVRRKKENAATIEASKGDVDPEDVDMLKAQADTLSSGGLKTEISKSIQRRLAKTRQTAVDAQKQQAQQVAQQRQQQQQEYQVTREQIGLLGKQGAAATREADASRRPLGMLGGDVSSILDLPDEQFVQALSSGNFDDSTRQQLLQYRSLRSQATNAGLQQQRLLNPQGAGRPLSAEDAAQLLSQAGGDKDKARQIARQLGYSF